MNTPQFDQILRHTLSDYRVSRGEKRVLQSILDEIGADPQQLGFLRHQAFEIARQEVAGPEAQGVIAWLEDIVKVLQPVADRGVEPAQAYFSPGSACVSAVTGRMRGTQRSMDICVFTITDNRIAEVIEESHQRRVRVRIISDNDKALDLGSDIQRLARAGIPVRVDQTRDHMHHKFAVFDGRAVLTGSYNWTRSASEHNEENIVIVNEQDVVRQFDAQFEKLWNSLPDFSV